MITNKCHSCEWRAHFANADQGSAEDAAKSHATETGHVVTGLAEPIPPATMPQIHYIVNPAIKPPLTRYRGWK
jgi:ABC-type uncharacterized transport system substrate-binding protein